VDLRALLASPLGFLIGLSLGALGGGGSILAVPALVYVAGQDPKAATATSLVLVGVTSLIGLIPHVRAGNVRVGAGLLFGLAGVAGNVAGSSANQAVDPEVLLLAFAGVMLVAAAAMWRRSNRPPAVVEGAALRVDAALVARVLAAGTVVGVLTGFFGVGGGFVIVPALVLALRFEMPVAVGTSLLVIAINSGVALLARLGSGAPVEWSVIVPFTVASVLGVFAGARVAARVPSRVLTRWFVYLLVAVAVYTAARSLLALL
jgi:uncharacterized protein